MIEINLLPEELKKRKRTATGLDISDIDFKKIPLLKIAGIAAGAVILIQLVVFGLGVMGGSVSKSLEKSYEQILPAKSEIEQLQYQISRMSKKVSAIDELMVKRFSWAKKLNDFERFMISIMLEKSIF